MRSFALRLACLAALLATALSVAAQQDIVVLRGRVLCHRHAIPYATLQLKGTSVGVAANDAGQYELRLVGVADDDSIVVRSVGYAQATVAVGSLRHNGNVQLREVPIELHEVDITDYQSALHLLLAAVDSITTRCHSHMAYSTFFYRDWRAVDDELYLYDEAVMSIKRLGYQAYASKRSYSFSNSRREMQTNIKAVLKHRMLVFDLTLLNEKIANPDGAEQMMAYVDNEDFFDPASTPQATYILGRHSLYNHQFEPIMEYSSDGEAYYLLRSVGPSRRPKEKVRYEYTVRKRDLAIVQITSSLKGAKRRAPQEAWINSCYNRMLIEVDSSAWQYDEREGRLTLTHYYNHRSYTLSASGSTHSAPDQRWQHCKEWTLTDFGHTAPTEPTDTIGAAAMPIDLLFGQSDYNTEFWGHYNTIELDALPLSLLKQKLLKRKP